MKLSEQVRKIKRLMQKPGEDACEGVAKVLKEAMSADIYITAVDGELLSSAFLDVNACLIREKTIMATGFFSTEFTQFLKEIEETQVVFTEKAASCIFAKEEECSGKGKVMAVIPVYAFYERVATLVLIKNEVFSTEELLLSECGSLVVSAEFLRTQSDVQEESLRDKASVKLAVATLSYSEFEAVNHILNKLGGDEGFLVASKVADSAQITRSVIVNALRKLESAGVIETRSLGMKGTYIRVINSQLFMTLKKARK